MTATLDPTEKARLRQFLANRFSLDELENLAFDLGVDCELFSHEKKQAFSRELIEYFEHRDQLSYLITEVLKQRPDNDLTQLLAKLPACSPSTKIQIIVSADLVEDISGLLDELAARLKLAKDEVVLVGAARGSMRLLISLPEKVADLQTLNEIRSLGNGSYQVVSIAVFDSLDSVGQKAWRLIARHYPPERQNNILHPTVSWQVGFEATRKAQTAYMIPSEWLPMMNAGTPVGSGPSMSVEGGANLLPTNVTQAKKQLALAIWKARHDQPDAARQLFQVALSLNPADAASRMAYAAFLAQQRDWTAAKQELKQAIADDAKDAFAWLESQLAGAPDDSSLLYLHALRLTHVGQYEQARVIFEQLTGATGYGQIWVDQAALLESMGDWEAADRSYQAALQTEADNVTWSVEYGTFLERRERDQDALRALEHALKLNSQDASLQERVESVRRRVNRIAEASGRAAWARLLLEEQGRVDEAAEEVAQALRLAPECAEAHRVQAEILRREGLLAQAEAHLEQALKLEPDNSEYQSAWQEFRESIALQQQQVQMLVSQARKSNNRELAQALLDKALGLIADDVGAHIAYAELIASDQPGDAERHLQVALSVDPRQPEANRQYAMLLRRQGRGTEAEQHFQAALALYPQDEALIYEYTSWLIEQGQYQAAADQLQATEIVSTSARLQGHLAVAWARLGRLADALPQFQAALQAQSQDATLHREYALALQKMGHQYAQAEDHFRTALELNQDDAAAHRGYAALLMTQQRYSEAQDHIRRAMDLCPGDADIQTEARTIQERLDQFDRAEQELAYAVLSSEEATPESIITARQAFELALNLEPDSIVVLKEYAGFLAQQTEFDRAKALLERALAIMPEEHDAKTRYIGVLKEHAGFLERQREFFGSKTLWEQIRTTAPEDQEAQARYIAVLKEYAGFLEHQGTIEPAKTAWEQVLAIAPGDQEAWGRYIAILKGCAESLERQGQLDSALKTLERILEITPGDREVEAHRARISAVLYSLVQPVSRGPVPPTESFFDRIVNAVRHLLGLDASTK